MKAPPRSRATRPGSSSRVSQGVQRVVRLLVLLVLLAFAIHVLVIFLAARANTVISFHVTYHLSDFLDPIMFCIHFRYVRSLLLNVLYNKNKDLCDAVSDQLTSKTRGYHIRRKKKECTVVESMENDLGVLSTMSTP